MIAFNRTKLELKLSKEVTGLTYHFLLIAPSWN